METGGGGGERRCWRTRGGPDSLVQGVGYKHIDAGQTGVGNQQDEGYVCLVRMVIQDLCETTLFLEFLVA